MIELYASDIPNPRRRQIAHILLDNAFDYSTNAEIGGITNLNKWTVRRELRLFRKCGLVLYKHVEEERDGRWYPCRMRRMRVDHKRGCFLVTEEQYALLTRKPRGFEPDRTRQRSQRPWRGKQRIPKGHVRVTSRAMEAANKARFQLLTYLHRTRIVTSTNAQIAEVLGLSLCQVRKEMALYKRLGLVKHLWSQHIDGRLVTCREATFKGSWHWGMVFERSVAERLLVRRGRKKGSKSKEDVSADNKKECRSNNLGKTSQGNPERSTTITRSIVRSKIYSLKGDRQSRTREALDGRKAELDLEKQLEQLENLKPGETFTLGPKKKYVAKYDPFHGERPMALANLGNPYWDLRKAWIPSPPKLKPDEPMDTKIHKLLNNWHEARRFILGIENNGFGYVVPGHLKPRGKRKANYYPLMELAVHILVEQGIPPARWCLYMAEQIKAIPGWSSMTKKQKLSRAHLKNFFGATVFEKKIHWYKKWWSPEPRTLYLPTSHSHLIREWHKCERDVLDNAQSEEHAQEIVDRYFPGDIWRQRVDFANKQADKITKKATADAQFGTWVWSWGTCRYSKELRKVVA